MDELSQKWKDLTDIQQASIIELMAGKHQGNVFASLMNNFDTAREALEVSANSSGSAMREHAKWSESLEAKLLKLQAAWQSLSQSFLDSSFLKTGLNFIIGLVDGVNKLIDTFGVLGTAIVAFTAFKSIKGQGFFRVIEDEAKASGKRIGNIFSISANKVNEAWNRIGVNSNPEFKKSLDADVASLKAYKQALNDGIPAVQAEKQHLKEASYAAREYAKNKEASAIEIATFEKEQKQANIALEASNKSLASTRAILKEYNSSLKDSKNQCKNTGLAQKDFTKAVGDGNKNLGNYLSGLKGGKASMSGYVSSLIKGKLATIGMTVATTALNMVLTMGASFIVSSLMSAISSWINAEKELAEKVEEVTSKFKEQHSELQKLKKDYDTSNEDSMISKYERLSKGVDSLGRNVSLTAAEYSEYQSIVDSIASQIPSLVSGYDNQGNAILSCKGNVEELTKAYKDLIHAQNQEILINNGQDIEKHFEDILSQTNGYDFLEQLGNTFSLSWLWGDDNLKVFDMKSNTANALNNLANATSKKEREKALKEIESWSWGDSRRIETIQALQNAGVDVDTYSNLSEVIRKLLEDEPNKIRNIMDNYYTQFDEEIAEYKNKATALLSDAFDVDGRIIGTNYGNISEELQSIAYQTINSLDFDFLSNLKENGGNIEQWTKEMLGQLNAISEVDNAKIETGFELQTQFNGGDISYGEYVNNLNDIQSTIDKLNLKDEAKEQLKIAFGLDEDGIIKQYESLVKRLTDSKNYDFDISEDEAKKLLDGLSSEELKIAVDVITDMSNNNYSETAEEIKNAIERELAIRGLSLDLKIEDVKTDLESLATALNEAVSGSGLSTESITAVEGMFKNLSGYDPSKLFERTANGVRLNSTEFKKLNSELKKTNTTKINKQMDSLGDIYNQTREELYRLTYGTDEYNEKLLELESIEGQIKDLEQLATGYEALTSAYQEWQMAESAGSQRSMYENIISGLEGIDDEIKRGWYDDATIEFLELLSGEDLSTAGIEKQKEAYKRLGKEIEHTTYSIRDFFTVDEDGNSTNAGVYNFLDAIGQMEEEKFGGQDVVQRDKNGNIIGFDFQLVGGDEVIAEALGVSEELVQIMVRAADDAGFVVSMDGTYQQLDILKEKAQEAAESLNRTLEKDGKEGFNFNFNSSDVDDITKQLGEAQKILDTFRDTDGTINTKLEGADEALTVASTLQSMLDKLTRPTYMDIEVSQVEDELQEPLRNLQELRRLLETEHQLKLSGADTTQLEESKQEVYKYFEELAPEIKTEIGLVDEKGNPLTGQALKDKLNSGDIAIEATVDIQMKMDDKLGILVDKALLDAGIIDGEEFNKRVNIYLDADVNNEDAKNKTDEAVDEVVTDTKSDVKSAKSEIKTEVDNAKSEVESVKSDIESEVSDAKSDVEGIKSEITNAKSDVEGLANTLESLQGVAEKISVSVDANLNGNVPKMDESEEIDDLIMFAEGAKRLKEVGAESVKVSVNANLDGNVHNLNEGKQIDDLLTFAAGASALKDLPENISVSVNASISDSTKDIMNLNESKQIDDLIMFAESAKKLNEIGAEKVAIEVDAKVSENTLNLMDLDESKQIDDLVAFAEGVKGITDLGLGENTDVKVSLDASVSDTTKELMDLDEGKQINDIVAFAKGVQSIKDLGLGENTTVKVHLDASVSDNTKKLMNMDEGSQINDLSTFADGVSALQGLPAETNVAVNAQLDGNVHNLDEGTQINDIITFAEGASALKAVGNESISVSVKANAEGNVISGDGASTNLTSLSDFRTIVSQMPSQTVTVTVKANVDSENVNKAIQLLKDVSGSGVFKDYSATVQVGATISKIDDTVVKNYIATEKQAKGKVLWSNDETVVNEFKNKIHEATGQVKWDDNTENLKKSFTATGTVNWTSGNDVKVKVISNANGTANVDGTTSGRAFAHGNWGIQGNGTALVGELGTETLVRDGRFYTIGDQGAEFIKYRQGDIIFNHKQTEELFKNGKVTSSGGRGKMFANGSAFAKGSTGSGGAGKYTGGSSNNSSSNNSSSNNSSNNDSSSDSSTEEEFKEIIDWIEVILDRVQRAINKFEKQANNIYKQWTTRNKALQNQIEEVSNEISLQQQAYNRYMQEANSVGLSEEYASKVRNGTIDIETITDEDLKQKIDDYQKWYESALECQQAIEDLKITESQLYQQRFENIQTEYDGILQGFEHTEKMLDEYVSQEEEKGHIVSKNYYQALYNNEESKIAALRQQQSALIAARDEAVASGKIEEGSQAWYDMCSEIDAVTQAIEEGETALLSYDKTMREIDWSIFDLIQERISDVTEEADFYINLMSNKKLFEKDGKLTEQGAATMALHAQNYNTNMYQADSYGEEIAKLNQQIANDPYNQDLINRRNELIELQRESILAAEDEKEAIRDLVEEGINLELDALQELIDKKNEALESEKDLYEYQKKVKEQTDEIASLEKQMWAYENDDSEEAKQKIQQIKVDLENAREELKETEWDKYISDTSALLDNLYLEYSTILNQRLDNVDELLRQVIDGINVGMGADGTIATALGADGAIATTIATALAKGGGVQTILNEEATKVGTTLSTSMKNIWNSDAGDGAKNVLTMYGESFKAQNTTLNTTLNGIKTDVSQMVKKLGADAKTNTETPKTKPSSKANPTQTNNNNNSNNNNNNNNNNSKSSGDGKPKVGDKVKFVSGKYYYDSQGKKPIGSKNLGKEVYITNINEKSWATHPYHISTSNKLGKGDLGWLKLSQISGYATGKKNFLDDEVAWTQEKGKEFIVRPSDGAILTPIARGDSVLNASASRNIWDMANNPTEFIRDNLTLGSTNIPNNSISQNNYTQNLDKVVFNLPNVQNYNELIATMQKDKNFEKLILSMSIDRLAGKSSLAKNKSIR